MKVYTTDAWIISTMEDLRIFIEVVTEWTESLSSEPIPFPLPKKILIINDGKMLKGCGSKEYHQAVSCLDIVLNVERHVGMEVSLIIDKDNLQYIDPRIRKHIEIETVEVLGEVR